MSFLFYFCLAIFLTLSVALMIIILAQPSSGGGLGASFGGGSSDSVFGTSTVMIVQKFTAYLSALFLCGAILLSIWGSHAKEDNGNLSLVAPTEESKS